MQDRIAEIRAENKLKISDEYWIAITLQLIVVWSQLVLEASDDLEHKTANLKAIANGEAF